MSEIITTTVKQEQHLKKVNINFSTEFLIYLINLHQLFFPLSVTNHVC